MPPIKTVLFDLDGTLIDTAPDMAAALDNLCLEEQQPVLTYDEVRPEVSNGSVALVQLAFGTQIPDARMEHLKTRYLEIYEEKIAVKSRLFSGTQNVLDQLLARGLNWGVVTNKPGWLTEPLMRALQLDSSAACIVSGDTTENRKPHPEPMYHACKLAGSEPAQCLYIGDARRDIEAGLNAGMRTLVAEYGYISALDDVNSWGADALIKHPAEILDYLQ